MTTKNIIRFTTAVLILGNLASCDGNLAPLEPELPPVEDSEALKNLVDTTFSASRPEGIVWKTGDKVAIYDGVAKREFTYKKIRNMRPGQNAIIFKLYITPSETQPVIQADDGVEAKKIQNVYVYCQYVVRIE